MIIPDAKKIMTILVNKRNAKGQKTAEIQGMQPESSRLSPEQMPRQSAAEDLIGAMHDKSPHRVIEALNSFLSSAPKKD